MTDHDGLNWASIDWSPRNIDANGKQIYDVSAIPVLAAAAGNVVMTSVSDPDPANGNYLVLDLDRDWNPETGFTTRYLHLDELLVTNGQSVKRGQQIGWMGSTGIDKNGNSTSTPKHLHFGLRYNNDGSSSRPEVTYVTMEGWLLKSFQTECSERTLRIHWATTSGTTVSSNTITAGAP